MSRARRVSLFIIGLWIIPFGVPATAGASEIQPPEPCGIVCGWEVPSFKIVVTGSNLQRGIRVFINGGEWSSVTYKNSTKIQLKGGASLKTVVPKGVPTTFRFLNPDGGEATTTWSY